MILDDLYRDTSAGDVRATSANNWAQRYQIFHWRNLNICCKSSGKDVAGENDVVLRYTGYPLVDVGATAIAAFSHKRNLDQVAVEDLDAMAGFIQVHYVQEPLKSFLFSIFPNSRFAHFRR